MVLCIAKYSKIQNKICVSAIPSISQRSRKRERRLQLERSARVRFNQVASTKRTVYTVILAKLLIKQNRVF